MVPYYLEGTPVIPMTLSNKADHKKLPKPQVPRFSAATSYVSPRSESERVLSQALVEKLLVERVSTEHHFFDRSRRKLAADGAFLRGHSHLKPGRPNVSMRDI